MTHHETIRVSVGVVATMGSGCHDIVGGIMFQDLLPEFVWILAVKAIDFKGGRPIDVIDGSWGVASINVGVVAVKLGKSFFQDLHPHAVIAGDLAEGRHGLAVPLEVRNVVIDDDSVRDTKSPQVDTIDASIVKIGTVVEEDFFHALGLFS